MSQEMPMPEDIPAQGESKEEERSTAQRLEVYEGGTSFALLILAGGLVCLAGLLLLPLGSVMWFTAFLLGLAGLLYPLRVFTRRNRPVIVLLPEGIAFSGVWETIPWLEVEECKMQVSGGSMTTSVTVWFHLTPGIELSRVGAFVKRDGRVTYHRGAGLVQVRVINFKGISPQKLKLLVEEYRHGGRKSAI